MDKKRREHIRRVAEGIENDGMKHYRIPFDELRALLDLADDRDRYRAFLAGYVGALEELARVHDALGYPMEAGCCRGKAHRIDAALEGKSND